MQRTDRTMKAILLTIALFLGMIAFRPFYDPALKVQAQTARFDHVQLVATTFLYKGGQGLLVLDKRNANVWFIPRVGEQFQSPVLIVRLPFEKLDASPQ